MNVRAERYALDARRKGQSHPQRAWQSGRAGPLRYITQGPVALYYTRDPAYAQVMQDAEKADVPYAAINPTTGTTHPLKIPNIQRCNRTVRKPQRHRPGPPAIQLS